jgi:hypothetical protein
MTAQETIVAVADASIRLVNVENLLWKVRDQMALIEREALELVLAAVDEKGKPLYSNEQARKLALDQWLSAHPTYLGLREELRTRTLEAGIIKADIESHRLLARVAILEYEFELLGRREAA